MNWKPDSWRAFSVRQQPKFENNTLLESILMQLKNRPQIVKQEEVLDLKKRLGVIQKNGGFLLQAGDCAERFADCHPEHISIFMNLMKEMKAKLSDSLNLDILPLGRIAGQYGKPRSAELEQVGSSLLPVFRGDNIHSIEKTVEARKPDSNRLLKGVEYSSKTMHMMKQWLDSNGGNSFSQLYSSHECLILPLEEALTKKIDSVSYGNLGAHLLWLGNRTNKLDEAHVEYLRGIENPIGIKFSRSISPKELVQIVKKLNPSNDDGKIILISRFGVNEAGDYLGDYVREVSNCKMSVLWVCDPMHGNTFKVGITKLGG